MIGLRLADVRTRRGDNEGARAVLAAELDARERYPEENAMLRIALAVLTYRAGDAAAARELADEAMREMRADARAPSRAGARPRGGARRGRHCSSSSRASREAAEPLLTEAYAVALATQDMPIVATRRRRRRRAGRPARACRWQQPRSSARLRACAAPRTATHPEVARLTAELRERARRRGLRRRRSGAVARWIETTP